MRYANKRRPVIVAENHANRSLSLNPTPCALAVARVFGRDMPSLTYHEWRNDKRVLAVQFGAAFQG